MTALQASLLCRPAVSQNYIIRHPKFCHSNVLRSSSLPNSTSLPTLKKISLRPPFSPQRLAISCTLQADNVNSSSESVFSGDDSIRNLEEARKLENGELCGESQEAEPSISVSDLENVGMGAESEVKPETLADGGGGKNKLPVVAFLTGILATAKNGLEKFTSSEWLNWWPFWRQEKRLERLIAEADANPKDAAKQSALLAELNKQRSFS